MYRAYFGMGDRDQALIACGRLLSSHLIHRAQFPGNSIATLALRFLLFGWRAWGGLCSPYPSAWKLLASCLAWSSTEHLNSPAKAEGRKVLGQAAWPRLSARRTQFPKCTRSGDLKPQAVSLELMLRAWYRRSYQPASLGWEEHLSCRLTELGKFQILLVLPLLLFHRCMSGHFLRAAFLVCVHDGCFPLTPWRSYTVMNLSTGFPSILITLAQQQMAEHGRSWFPNHFSPLGVALSSLLATCVSESHIVCVASLRTQFSLSASLSFLPWQEAALLCCFWECLKARQTSRPTRQDDVHGAETPGPALLLLSVFLGMNCLDPL